MIEEPQRSSPSQRRQPEGETRQMHGCAVPVDARETSLGNAAAHLCPRVVVDVFRRQLSFFHQGIFVGVRKVAAGCHEERAAAHGRIEHAQVQNAV